MVYKTVLNIYKSHDQLQSYHKELTVFSRSDLTTVEPNSRNRTHLQLDVKCPKESIWILKCAEIDYRFLSESGAKQVALNKSYHEYSGLKTVASENNNNNNHHLQFNHLHIK